MVVTMGDTALGDDWRYFSYYKALSVLEKVPFKITSVDQIKGLPTLGKSLLDTVKSALLCMTNKHGFWCMEKTKWALDFCCFLKGAMMLMRTSRVCFLKMLVDCYIFRKMFWSESPGTHENLCETYGNCKEKKNPNKCLNSSEEETSESETLFLISYCDRFKKYWLLGKCRNWSI